ncbi:cytochrome P450 4V2 [Caerostris extrusa]|uniref:Cytochrome P450 4V2 n=1 Tax=Caerostris extrusa TaxID=172846 RepID=A0AAV4RLM3_CAEEX|nr:cytochrome P450 4V2 [Caerostris extrusa]
MFFEVIVCAFIGIVAVFAILTLWRKKYRRFVPDNKHSVFQVLLDAIDSILFVTSGKKNALHLYIVKYFTEKSKIQTATVIYTLVVWCPMGNHTQRRSSKRTFERKENNRKNDVSQWKERKKLLAAGFQNNMLKGYLAVMNEHAQKLVEFLHGETGKDFTCIESPISLCSLDIVCESILGLKIGALQSEAEEYVSSLHRLLELAMTRIWKFWLWSDFMCHRTNDYKEALQHIKITHGFSRSIVKERKVRYMNGEMGDDSRRPKCLLDILLKLHIEDQVLDEEGVRQEVDTFIGHDTVTVAVKWALYLIGLYTEVQEKIHQELDSVLGADSKGALSVADLNELKYLECVLKASPSQDSSFKQFSRKMMFLMKALFSPEILPYPMHLCLCGSQKECNRLYPPVPLFARKVSEETSICGHTIPKRTTVVVTPFLVHRDEDVFPDPEKFDPERFLPENSTHIPECAYIPFAAGPRNCIGRVFGEMEVKLLVCHILRSFSLHSLDSRDQVLPVAKITLQSSEPARIKFRRRQQ